MMPPIMIMAAGLGTRMRPLTDHMPKPLVAVAGKPLIDHTLDWAASAGVHDAVVNSHYKADMLHAHLQARSGPPAVRLSHEDTLLETGGGIRHALPLLGGGIFFSANSDVICIDGKTPALQRLLSAWDDDALDALLLLHPVDKAVGYEGRGDFFLEDATHVRRRAGDETAPLVFTGVQLLHPRLFAHAPEGAFSLNLLYNAAMQSGQGAPRLKALVHDADWLHVGDPKGLAQADAWFAAR